MSSLELRRRLLMHRENLSFKELFVDDPLIPESKARTVESVIEEIGFDAREKFNRAAISFRGLRKSTLIALGKDTTKIEFSWIGVSRVYENDKVVQEVVGNVIHTFTSTDSIKYIVLYSTEKSYGDWPQSAANKVNVKWVVFGNEYKVTSILFGDYIISYHRDDTFNDYGYLKRLNYSGSGQLRFPEEMEWIGGQFFRECSLPNITSIRIPKAFKGTRALPYQPQWYPFYNFTFSNKVQYIHYLGTLEDWLRISLMCAESFCPRNPGFGNGEAMLKFGENYDIPTEANFPEDMTSIGYRVLCNFPQFTKITMHAGVSEIKNMAFYGQINADIYVDKTMEEYKQISFGLYWHTIDATRDLYLQNQKITEVTINSNEELKGNYMSPFESFSIEKLTIADDVTTIPVNAFRKCNLKEVNWGSGITKIEEFAFWRAFHPESQILNIPEGVISVGRYAFAGIKGYVKEIVLPSTLETVGTSAFNLEYVGSGVKIWINNPNAKYSAVVFNCSNNWASEVHFAGNSEQWCKIGFTDLSMVNLWLEGEPAVNVVVRGVEVARRYLFNGCNSIRTIIVEEGVTTINMYAVTASYATYLELPKSFQKFEGNCIGPVGYLGEGIVIKFKWTEAETILNPSSWRMTTGNKVTLQVPQGMTQAYRDAGYTEDLWPNMVEY